MALSKEEISQIAKEAADKVVSATQGCRCGKAVWDARANIASFEAVVNRRQPDWLQPLPQLMKSTLTIVEQECGVDMSRPQELTQHLEGDIKKGDWSGARANLALLQGSIVGPLEQCAIEGEKETGVEVHNPAVVPQDLAEKVHELWRKACEWEDIPLDAKFVVFSEDNPFVKDYNEAVGQLLRWKQFQTGEWAPATTFKKGESTKLDGLEVVKAYKQISSHGEDKISVSLQAWALFPRGRRPHFISMYRSGDDYVITPLYAHISEWVHVPVVKVKAWIKSLPVKHFEPMAVAPEYREEAERLAKEVDEPMAILPLPSMARQPAVIPTEPELSPSIINLLAKTEGDPIRKFCCRQCGECAPAELLEEGRFPDRIAWLRSHYKSKHPGIWGKTEKLPQTEYWGKSSLPPEVSDILNTEGSWMSEKFKLPSGKAMPRTPEQSKRIVELALKANWGANQVALTSAHPAWKAVIALEDLMSDKELTEYQRRRKWFVPQGMWGKVSPEVTPVTPEVHTFLTQLSEKYNIHVTGSYARGEARVISDIDIIVSVSDEIFNEPMSSTMKGIEEEIWGSVPQADVFFSKMDRSEVIIIPAFMRGGEVNAKQIWKGAKRITEIGRVTPVTPEVIARLSPIEEARAVLAGKKLVASQGIGIYELGFPDGILPDELTSRIVGINEFIYRKDRAADAEATINKIVALMDEFRKLPATATEELSRIERELGRLYGYSEAEIEEFVARMREERRVPRVTPVTPEVSFVRNKQIEGELQKLTEKQIIGLDDSVKRSVGQTLGISGKSSIKEIDSFLIKIKNKLDKEAAIPKAEVAVIPTEGGGEVSAATISTKICPECGKPMKLRYVSKLGEHWWIHEYPMGKVMAGERLCIYSEKAKPEDVASVTPEVTGRKFIGVTKSTDPTQIRAPWRVAYEREGKEYAGHFSSKEKAIQYAKDKLGVELDPKTLKPIPEVGKIIPEVAIPKAEAGMPAVIPTEPSPSWLERLGDCYRLAWRFIIKEEEGWLVHGKVFAGTLLHWIEHAWVELPTGFIYEPIADTFYKKDTFYEGYKAQESQRYTATEAAIMAARTKTHGPWTEAERKQYLKEKIPAVIPTEPRPPSPKLELEFVSDSPEFLAYTIEDIGYREKLDTAFETAIARAKGG